MSSHEENEASVEIKGEILRRSEKSKDEQRQRVKDSALSSDHRSDCIGIPRKKT